MSAGPEAPNHDVPSTLFHSWDEVLILMCCAICSPHIVLCVPTTQPNLVFICQQNILPVLLWNIKFSFADFKHAAMVFFGLQQLPLWSPPMNCILVCFAACRFVNQNAMKCLHFYKQSVWPWTPEHQSFERYFCKPVELQASLQLLIVGLFRVLLYEWMFLENHKLISGLCVCVL